MDKAHTVCALYSRGPHFTRLIAQVRKVTPFARVIALVPPNYPADHLEDLADEVVTVGPARGLAGLRAVRERVRLAKADALVVMFDSPRLRMLAKVCPVRYRYCYTIDGRFFPVRMTLVRQTIESVTRAIRGRLTYRRIRRSVYRHPVEPGKTPTPPV